MRDTVKRQKYLAIVMCLFLLLACVGSFLGYRWRQQSEEYTSGTFAMDTMVEQLAYGPRAQDAMLEVNVALAGYEQRLSMFDEGSDIAAINEAAGTAVPVQPETLELLGQALELSSQSEGAFAISIGPLTQAWGVTGNEPNVLTQEEIDTLLPLVDDGAVILNEDGTVLLGREGMALDLGGVAKGAACSLVRDIYNDYGVKSALLNIGGNIYAHGTKPDGTPFQVGFRDPAALQGVSIASFELENQVVAVSGGYERYFEEDGETYIHIIDPRTGRPARSDIASVGVIHEDGAVADFYSTTLFVWGRERALAYMREGGLAILLDEEGTLYVSAALQGGFKLYDAGAYELVYVEATA